MSEQSSIVAIYLQEYTALKAEQSQRIGFRDNLLYVTLGAFGAILSFTLPNKGNYYALLSLPWISLILGWTYLMNDLKISAIGQYIRYDLSEKLRDRLKEAGEEANVETVLGWETAHRSDRFRKRRKVEQFLIDLLAFVFSGAAGVVTFWVLVPDAVLALKILGVVELLFLFVLGVEIFLYADFKFGR